MALQLSKELANGATASYHRISFIARSLDGTLSITLDSYIDKAARDAKKMTMCTGTVKLPAQNGELTLENLYTAIKALSDFQGATDI